MALAAGFLQANDFDALHAIRDLARDGQLLDELAARAMEELPAKLAPALKAARKAGDETLRRTLQDQDALEVRLAIIGMRDGVPGVIAIAFRALTDDGGGPSVFRARRRRFPGDCAAGAGSFFLGAHETIEKAIAGDPSLSGADVERRGISQQSRIWEPSGYGRRSADAAASGQQGVRDRAAGSVYAGRPEGASAEYRAGARIPRDWSAAG